jgi:uncharacterized protein
MSFTTVIVNFTAKPGMRDAVVAMLSQAVQKTITNPDCWKVDLVVDEDSDDPFYMVQDWTHSDAHKAYVEKVMADPKMGPVMEALAAPPDTRYCQRAAAGGGEWGGPAHLEISSNDVPATSKFLTDVFGWSFNEWMPGYTGFWAPGALMGGLRPKMDEEEAPQAIPYLVVNDLDARLEAVQAAGGTITVPIQTVPNAGRFFWFLDPGGLQLAAWESASRE